ncbi:prolyl oligopeptidase family serine peptidase [Flavobacteriaceae bacterium F89]|uniref:Prolyl oligopeptidase family serine peptidase n=1 Tax=Cerina litoralis TaxID=2874477 RepID=A0AAE3ESD4_9FLAO|nr:prolyl oligopeptidase family serine peptidase [Cerina litoralis]MCG2459573.1 prolyl oligopeptidase family serine peptidase [Cerina litoralis]
MKYPEIFAMFLFTVSISAQSYLGTLNYGKSTINYKIKLTKIDNHTNALFSSVEMNAYEIPCRNSSLQQDSLKFYVVSDYYTYEYKYIKQNENFKGLLKIYSNENEQLLNTLETELIPENKIERDLIKKQDLRFTSNGLKLYGTLWEPKNPIQKGLFFVTSSQGNNRSGSNAEASYFVNLGYTVFNYDKRGTGKSEGNWQSATIEELCSDDINAILFFSETTSLPLSEIGIKGSSQGGIKIPYILTEIPALKFGISVSCPSGSLLESDLNNWENANIELIGKENIKAAYKVQKAGYDYLANNLSYKKLMAVTKKYKNKSWFKYIWIPEENIQKDYKLNFTGLPYFKKLSQPILVMQGLSDNVIPRDSYKIIEKAIKKSESKKYKILTLQNATHSMTILDKAFPYFQILSPQYLVSIVNWMRTIENN